MKPSICFVSPNGYSVLSGDPNVRHIGGAEVQQVLVARGLAERGYQISFVTLDSGQPRGENINGIRVYPGYAAADGLPGIRFIHPRATHTWKAMAAAEADVYYQRTSDSLTGIVAAYCRWKRRRFVFSAGHDADCIPELPHCRTRRERVLYRYGLRRADAVVVQTTTQRKAMNAHFGVDAVLIPSCTAEPERGRVRPSQHQRSVLWLGRFAPVKRLGLLLEVAERCPTITFHVVGDALGGRDVESLRQRAEEMANVRLHGYVPHQRIGALYDGATAIICTSLSEGFPNTFLEAWSRGLPVVTSFDPDGVVEKFRLGLVAMSCDLLSGAVRQLCSDDSLWTTLAQNARNYYQREHTVGIAVERYERLFERLHSATNTVRRGRNQHRSAEVS